MHKIGAARGKGECERVRSGPRAHIPSPPSEPVPSVGSVGAPPAAPRPRPLAPRPLPLDPSRSPPPASGKPTTAGQRRAKVCWWPEENGESCKLSTRVDAPAGVFGASPTPLRR